MGTGEPVLSLWVLACVEPMGTGEPMLSLWVLACVEPMCTGEPVLFCIEPMVCI